MFNWFTRLFRTVTPVEQAVVTTAPTTAPVQQRVITGVPLDTRGWQGAPTSDWVWYDQRITYMGTNNEALSSFPIKAVAGDVVKAECTVAGDSWGERAATGAVSVTPYRADGRSIGTDSDYTVFIKEGTSSKEVVMPVGTDHYKIALLPKNTTESGTRSGNPAYDGKELRVTFVNLTIG